MLLVAALVADAVAAVDGIGGSDGIWQRVSEDQWRESQRAFVDERLRSVPARHRRRCANVLRGEAAPGFSQAWQDWLLYRNFFAGRSDGLYLDIGTNDAIHISNTAFFDLCLGWRGVCFEPQAKYHERIRAERNCTLVPHCVLGRAANVSAAGSGGSMALTPTSAAGGDASMSCIGMRETLRALGLHGQRVDLLSIDIEGSEPSVLRCLPWELLDIAMVLIETNKVADMRLLDTFFSAHGYANGLTLLYKDGRPLDNLYIKLPGGKLVGPRGEPECTADDQEQTGGLCGPWRRWVHPRLSAAARMAEWSECPR